MPTFLIADPHRADVAIRQDIDVVDKKYVNDLVYCATAGIVEDRINKGLLSDDKWMSLCRGLKTLFETKIGEPIDISDAEFMDVLKGAF